MKLTIMSFGIVTDSQNITMPEQLFMQNITGRSGWSILMWQALASDTEQVETDVKQ